MGLVKGSAALCRYRIIEQPESGPYTTDQIQSLLKRHAFADIETAPEESSVGWVEAVDHFTSSFAPGSFDFGNIYAFGLRLDERKLSGKILNRYYGIAESKLIKETGKKPNSLKRNQMKESLRLDLLKRSLLTTSVWEVVWLADRDEIWLDSSSEKVRALFEDQWARTFSLAIRLLVPISIGFEHLDKQKIGKLMRLEPMSIWEG